MLRGMLFFLRHASAVHNEEHDRHKPTTQKIHELVTDLKFLDPPLTPSGIESVIRNRQKVVQDISHQLQEEGEVKKREIEVILVSPLKRALQTLLLTLPALRPEEKTQSVSMSAGMPEIYVVGCLVEWETEEEQKLSQV